MKRAPARSMHANKEELLAAAFTLCGMDRTLSSEELANLIERSKRRSEKRIRELDPGRVGKVNFDALGHVVYRWKRANKYLDDDGRPLRLPLRGVDRSVESLFRETGHKDYFELGVRHLREVGRVKKSRDGRYFPCGEVSIVHSLSPELVELLAQTINRVVATVLHNTSLPNKKMVRLIERVTLVPDLPNKSVTAFKNFAREQGGALIDTMNEWLENRRGNQVRRHAAQAGRITAGLHVFAFVEKNS
jgi:Family of unknown function (DUF6502)